MKEKFYLDPNDSRKSFYRKCYVFVDCGIAHLVSYETHVASIRLSDKEFMKVWNGYSVTTMRHINAFRAHYGLIPINKKEWDRLNRFEYVAA